jgi:hypothetical protein
MKKELQPSIESTLRWPDGWPRTLIEHRQSRNAWRKAIMEYQKAITKELIAMKVTAASITFNPPSVRDPGVAVWYSLESAEDVSWQIGLQIDNPAPTLDQIDSAFKRLALKCHPDTHPDDPSALEMFKKINAFRDSARAYILGTAAPRLENCIPMDRFVDVKQNLAGVRLFLSYVRGMERLGGPAVVKRIMERTFRTALTAGASSEDSHEPAIA